MATPVLTETERAELLKIARTALTAYVAEGRAPDIAAADDLARPAGAFVTLHNHGDLRGCIGHIEPDQPLASTIARCAIAAASSDPRFPAVTATELPHLDIELSVLGPLEPVQSLEDIEIGRDGLVVEMGWHRGLLLPQVATEWNWDRKTFLEQTCHKAGLPKDAWKHGAKVFKFAADVFGEHEATREGQEGRERQEGPEGQEGQEGPER